MGSSNNHLIGGSISGVKKGPKGYSAYELALQVGFIGTMEQWLLSLKGESGIGTTGKQGIPGPTGERGLVISATEPLSPTEGLLWIDIS